MRILQVIPTFSAYFGGPVAVVRLISKELAKKHDVIVYTTSALDKRRDFKHSQFKIEVDGYQVIYFPRVIKFIGFNISPTMAIALKKTISEFDIIHLHSWRQFQDLVVNYYAKKFKVPYVLQTHGSLPRIMAKKKMKLIYDVFFGYRVLRDAYRVIAVNKLEAEQYKTMGVPEKKIAIIPNTIDLSEYTNLPPKGLFKRKFKIPEDKKVILYLGRLHRIKGLDFLVKAYAYLTRKISYKDAVLVLVGPDDGYLNELKDLVQVLGISNSVLFTGPLYGRDKLEAYVDSDVYVLPSRYEIWGITVLEAYACGKPVIASNVGGLRSLIINGKTGLLIEPGNIFQLAKMIKFLLEDQKRAEDMGLNGKQFVKENFSIEKVISKLENVYRGMS